MTTVTLPDLAYQSLGSLGYTGSLVERKFKFFKDNGAVSNNVVNAEFEWLTSLGYTQSTLVDKRAARLRNLGYTDLSGYTAAFDNVLYYSNRNLFLNNEQGVWYDPSDLSTLFQDSAGTTPVTAAGQPVGLILDKNKGLVPGSELSAYASGFSSTSGIAVVGATVALSGTSLAITATSTDGSDRAEVPVSGLTVGAYYKATVVARRGAQGIQQSLQQWTIGSIPVTAVASSNAQTYTFIFPATAASGVMRCYSAAAAGAVGDVLLVDSISVRELPGNHASQSTATARPILRQTPVLGSELVTNGAFDADTNWTKENGWTISGGKLRYSVSGTGREAYQTIPTIAGRTYSIEFAVDSMSSGQVGIYSLESNVTSAVFSTSLGTRTLAFVATGATMTVRIRSSAAGSGDIVIDNVSVREVISYRTDQNYLEFDGVDDFLVTQSIDFTATDKMTVWAGVRKMSDAVVGMVCESSSNSDTTNGAFSVRAPGDAATANYYWGVRGDTAQTAFSSAGYAAPTSNVVSCRFDLAGTGRAQEVFPRIDGTIPTLTVRASGAAGGGNFGNHPLYIGRRGGTSLPFNGRLYGLIVRGAASSTAQIIAAERELAKHTGVTL